MSFQGEYACIRAEHSTEEYPAAFTCSGVSFIADKCGEDIKINTNIDSSQYLSTMENYTMQDLIDEGFLIIKTLANKMEGE